MIEISLYPDVVWFFFSLFRKTSASARARGASESERGAILGDPGADSGGEGKSKQAEKYGTKEK